MTPFIGLDKKLSVVALYLVTGFGFYGLFDFGGFPPVYKPGSNKVHKPNVYIGWGGLPTIYIEAKKNKLPIKIGGPVFARQRKEKKRLFKEDRAFY